MGKASRYQPMPVYMETETEGATIFYTSKLANQGCPSDPTHDANGNPTGETLVYDPASPPTVNVGTGVNFSALGYKEGLADSEVTACFREDNVQERPLDGPLRTVSYTWDKAGNRSVVTDTAGVTQNYITNELNQYKNINGVPMSNGPAHQIASFDGVSYNYIGDMYPARATAGANTYTLYYDALGRVVRRERFDVNTFTTTTNYYLFDGAHWVLEYNPDGTVQSNVLYGNGIDEIVGRHNNSVPLESQNQWPYPDRNNNTSVVTGDGGAVLEYYRYDAFGQPTVYDGNDNLLTGTAIANRFLFTGREWNPEYKFYEYRARAYSPSLGRFMSEDPKDFEGGDYNLYRYVGNDPLDRTDPMGLTDVPTTREEDIAGRDAAVGALLYAAQRFKAGLDKTPQDYGQGVRSTAAGLRPSGKFFKEELTTTKVFQDGRLKTVQAKTEKIETSKEHPVTGHVHHDVSGQPRSSSDASTFDLDAAKSSKVYRVNESNPNVIWRAVPQVEGTTPVDRPFDRKTMEPIDPAALKQKTGQ